MLPTDLEIKPGDVLIARRGAKLNQFKERQICAALGCEKSGFTTTHDENCPALWKYKDIVRWLDKYDSDNEELEYYDSDDEEYQRRLKKLRIRRRRRNI